jgi:hypothetical protein
MRQHNESLHIFSMIGRACFHRKIIAEVRLIVFRAKKIGDERLTCGEKDTRRGKLLQCTAHNCEIVTYYAGRLSNSMSI